MASLRRIVDTKKGNVDIKYGKKGEMRIYTRILLQSNHVDGLPIDDTDERFEVFINRAPKRSSEYYVRLYKLLDDPEFLAQVHKYLSHREYKLENLQTSRKTAARAEVINATMSKVSRAFYQFKFQIGVQWFDYDTMIQFMNRQLTQENERQLDDSNSGELKILMRRELRSSDVLVRAHKRKYLVYTFDHIDGNVKAKHVRKSISVGKQKIEVYFQNLNSGDSQQ